MKNFLAIMSLSAFCATPAFATCSSAALWAAKEAYGNDPQRTTQPQQLTDDTWEVTVGIGNHEDGAHTYQVTFPKGSCDPQQAIVCDITQPSANDPRACHE